MPASGRLQVRGASNFHGGHPHPLLPKADEYIAGFSVNCRRARSDQPLHLESATDRGEFPPKEEI